MDIRELTVLPVSSFSRQFNGSNPSPRKVEECWKRLLRDNTSVQGSVHPKGFVMATLYMLHIERYSPGETPKGENKTSGAVHPQRRELLKRYGNWVECQCHHRCGVEWNFANDFGLHRGQNGEQKCAMIELFQKTTLTLSFRLKERETLLDKTRVRWERSEVPW